MAGKLYKDYFQIDPKYFPQVTEALIKEGKVSWKNYFANDSFINVLNQACDMISGKNSLSMFTWGPYGSGKSHLILTLISMLRAEDKDIEEYFEDQNLSKDLMNKFIAMKNSGKILTIHRIGSANITTENDLILAVQQSIMAALKENGIENQGDFSMKESFLEFISKPVNRNYFSELITDEKYIFEFGNQKIDDIENIIRGDDNNASEDMMRKVMKVMKDIGQYGILKDADAMSDWIKDIIQKNDLKAIVFAWDEFSEFLLSHPMGLTGFQTLLEISNSLPFYFIIVTHEAEKVFADAQAAKKFLDRFQKPVEISLPENTAFKLLSQAMKLTTDPVLRKEWDERIHPTLNMGLSEVRKTIIEFERTSKSKKSSFNDNDLQSVVPIHPYAALILRQIASMFNSNQRSMFDFIINENSSSQGFKWFINTYGPMDKINILTVDMLWDFFCSKQVNGLSDDVRGIFLSYDGLKSESLLPEEQRVLKTILILQAVTVRIANDDLLSPNEQTLDLSFKGTEWSKGKAISIARGLVEKGLVFEKPMANGKKEYCVANGNVGDDIKKYRDQVIAETKTTMLITNANLAAAVTLPKAVEMRYKVEYASEKGIQNSINNLYKHDYSERFKTIVTFAMNDNEASQIRAIILKNMNLPNNDIIYIETLVPMGNDLYDQYIEAMAFSKYYGSKDKSQALHYQSQAEAVLRSWNQNISNGAFMLFTPENKNGERKANLNELQESLKKYDFQKYPLALEQYTLNATLYGAFNLSQGAELGIREETKSAYHIANKNLSIENALEGAWKVEKYWEDTSKQSLVIVKVKKKLDEIIEDSFKNNNGEVSVLSVFEEMEKPPFGFLPNAITSFVIGFCLKEYANANYFWSNHSNTETMTVEKMKNMIGNALAQKTNPSKNYKPEFIVTMTAQMREFLNGSSAIFNIPEQQCTSIEAAKTQIRIKMKEYQFPVWCLKYILDKETLTAPKEVLVDVIDSYTGIANTMNTNQGSESVFAEKLGSVFIDTPDVINDLKKLVNDSKCREGMLAYIAQYKDGELQSLAAEINDNGLYIDEVKNKFSAGDGNWLWSTETADERISDVILEYKIIKESNKSLSSCHKLSEVVSEWNRRTNNIKIPCEVVAKQVGDLGLFLYSLASIKRNSGIPEQEKQRFYDQLVSQREAFDEYYKNQVPYFKVDAGSFLTELEDSEITEIYNSLPQGQFTKGKNEYYKLVEETIQQYLQSQCRKKMQEMWSEKTGTKDPADWSDKYLTPILIMVNPEERANARKMFDIIKSSNPSEDDVKDAIEFMENAQFFDILENESERDRRFMEQIVGSNSILLTDVKDIRNKLRTKLVHETPYYWVENSEVQRYLKTMADKEYKLHGSEKANQIIDNMDTAQLREYLKRRIEDDAEFGIQILKGEGGR